MRTVCGRANDPRGEDIYDDTCARHPAGCHVQVVAPGVEFHETPAYAKKPAPGAVEAESLDAEIELHDTTIAKLRVQRQVVHDEAYAKGMNI